MTLYAKVFYYAVLALLSPNISNRAVISTFSIHLGLFIQNFDLRNYFACTEDSTSSNQTTVLAS